MPTIARIHYEIPDDLHRRSKSAAALQGVTLKQFLENALEAATKGAEKTPRKSAGPLRGR